MKVAELKDLLLISKEYWNAKEFVTEMLSTKSLTIIVGNVRENGDATLYSRTKISILNTLLIPDLEIEAKGSILLQSAFK